jgi:hypothetical protein
LTEVSISEIEKALENGDSRSLEQALKTGRMITFRFNYRKFLISRYPEIPPNKIDNWRGLVYLLIPLSDLFKEKPEINVQRDNGSACIVTIKWE